MADLSRKKKVITVGLITVLVIAAVYFIFVMSMPGDETVKKPALLDNSNKQVEGASC